LSRSFIKIKLIFFFIVLILLFTLGVNLFLPLEAPILESISKNFPVEIKVEKVIYLFPNIIVFNRGDVKVKDSSQEFDIKFPKIIGCFSLWEAIVNHQFIPSVIVLYQTEFNWDQAFQFIKIHEQEFQDFLSHLPRNNLTLLVVHNRFKSQTAGGKKGQDVDFIFRLTKNRIRASGSTRLFYDQGPSESIKTDPVYFDFDGSLLSDGLSFSRLHIKNKDVRAQLWGQLASSVLQLNGFVLMDKIHNNDTIFDSSTKNLVGKLKDFGRNFGFFVTEDNSFQPNIFLLDFNARVKLSMTHLEFQRLGFSLNDLPFSLSGSLDFHEGIDVDFLLSASLVHTKNLKNLPFIELTMKVQGKIQDSKFLGLVEWNLKPRQNNQATFLSKDIKIVLQGSEFHLKPGDQMTVRAKDAEFSFHSSGGEHKFFCREWAAKMTLASAYKYFESQGSCYGGTMENRGWIDFSSWPPPFWVSTRLSEMQVSQMQELLVHFSKFQGKLSSSIFLKTSPNFEGQGQVHLTEGNLRDFDFFNWIADTFGLKSFKKLAFESAASSFSIDHKGVNLQDIVLVSPLLKVQGYFKKDFYDMVTSRLSLSFSKELLSESPRFKALIQGFNEDPVTFDFKLSGNFQTMNFQWLDNETKRKIADRIPNFIERKIEQGVERMR